MPHFASDMNRRSPLEAWVACTLSVSISMLGSPALAGQHGNIARILRKVDKQHRPKIPQDLLRIVTTIRRGKHCKTKTRSRQLPSMDGRPLSEEGILRGARVPSRVRFVENLVGASLGAVVGTPKLENLFKIKDSARRKVKDEYEGDVSLLRDALRARIVYPDLEGPYHAARFIKSLENHPSFAGMKIVQIKDRIAKPKDSGYSDLKLYIQTPDGYVFELQLLIEPMEALKRVEQPEYERRRAGKVEQGPSEKRSNRLFASGLSLLLNSAPTWTDWPGLVSTPSANAIRSTVQKRVYEHFSLGEAPLQYFTQAELIRRQAVARRQMLLEALLISSPKKAERIVAVKDSQAMYAEIGRLHGGDPQLMLDVLEGITLYDTLPRLYVGLAHLARQKDIDFVSLHDGFTRLAPGLASTRDPYPEVAAHIRLPGKHVASLRLGMKALNAVREAFEPVVDKHVQAAAENAARKNRKKSKKRQAEAPPDPSLFMVRANQAALYRATLGILGY